MSMSRLFRFAEVWFLNGQPTDSVLVRQESNSRPRRPGRRLRPKATLTMESVEPRLLLSTTHGSLLAAPVITYPSSVAVAHVSIEAAGHEKGAAAANLRIKQNLRIQLTGISASGIEGGSATITATLTSNGMPLSGRIVRFQIRGHIVGKATTGADGVATLSNASIKGMRSGTYAHGVTAEFMGDATHKRSLSQGALTVSRFSTGLSDVSATGAYGGTGLLLARLNSKGAPLAGQAIRFQLNGHEVGVATTNAQGVATLGNASLAGMNAGVYAGAVTASFAGGTTYQKNAASGTLTVSQAQANVNLGGLTQTYDGTAKAVTVTTSPSSLPYSVAYTDASGNAVTSPEAAGHYNVQVTITNPNYTGTTSGQLVIAPVQIGVSGITASAKVFDGTTVAAIDTSGVALSGVVGGDRVTLDTTGATGHFASRDAGADKTVTIAGLTLTGPDAGNYVIAPAHAIADITPAPLTVTGVAASNKVYDGTTAATLDISGAVLSGVIAGDDVMLDASGAAGVFDSKDVGTGKTVTVTGLPLGGADAGNYVLVPPTTTATADITAAALTVTGINASNKVYDGTATAAIDSSGAALSGVVAGDDVTLDVSGAVGVFDSRDAGAGKTVTIAGPALGGADAGNYVLVQPATTADITAAPLNVTGITASNKVYDGTATATIDNSGAVLSGVVVGDDVTLDGSGAAGVFDSKDAGAGKTVTVNGLVLGGSDAGNYVIVPPTTTADITAASLTVTGITANNKGFDGGTDATLDFSGAVLSGMVAGDDVTLDGSGATGTFDSPDIGAGKTVTIAGLSLSGSDAGNYVLVLPTTTSADITLGTLTVSGITANGKVYDGTTTASLDTSGARLLGVAAGDDVTLDVSGGAGVFDSKDAGAGKTVTISGMTLSGADAWKYELAPPTTTADITAAALTVTGINASNKVYDGTATATVDTTGAELSGVVAGDDATLDGSGAAGVFDSKDAGAGKTVTVNGLVLSGSDAGNYVIVPPTTSADITAASLTVTGINAGDKVYDGTSVAAIDAGGAVLSGVVAGDDVTLDGSGAAGVFDYKDAGTGKTVTISGLVLGGADAGNYVIVPPTTTTADITAASLTVTGINASNKVYDGTATAAIDTTGAELSGVVAGDDATLDGSGAAGVFDSKDAGAGKTVTVNGLVLSGSDAGNYVIVPPTTSADITAASLTVTGINAGDKVYDGSSVAAIDAGGAVLSGVIAGDDVTLDGSSAAGVFDTKDAGAGKTVTVNGLALGGADAGNYVIVSPTTSADITAASLTVTGINAGDKVYDGTSVAAIEAGGAVLSGVIAGDDVTLDGSGAAGVFGTQDAGTGKTVTVNGLAARRSRRGQLRHRFADDDHRRHHGGIVDSHRHRGERQGRRRHRRRDPRHHGCRAVGRGAW